MSARDPLLREVQQTLKPLLDPAAEKAAMLVEHLLPAHAGQPKGLADAIRRLRAAKLSDAQISDGAKALMADLAKQHGHETVV